MLGRDFISIADFQPAEIGRILDVAMKLKARGRPELLTGRTLAMIFEKPSLRTRVTFEVGMTSMGGFAVYLDHSKPRLGERESIKDVARNLGRWVNGIVARTFSHNSVVELAENASIRRRWHMSDSARWLSSCQKELRNALGIPEAARMAAVRRGDCAASTMMR